MARRRPALATVLAALAVVVAACGEDGAGVAKDSPEALWAAYTGALPTAEADAVCGLFTEEGASSFGTAWGADGCPGAVDRAAAALDDPAGFADSHRAPHTKDEGNQEFIEMTDCGVGALTAKRVEGGWLISDYRHPETVGYCDG